MNTKIKIRRIHRWGIYWWTVEYQLWDEERITYHRTHQAALNQAHTTIKGQRFS